MVGSWVPGELLGVPGRFLGSSWGASGDSRSRPGLPLPLLLLAPVPAPDSRSRPAPAPAPAPSTEMTAGVA